MRSVPAGVRVLVALVAAAVVATGCTANPPAPVTDPAASTTRTTAPAAPDVAEGADPARTIVLAVDDLGPGFNPHLLADQAPVATALAGLVLPSPFRPTSDAVSPAERSGDAAATVGTRWEPDASLVTSAEVTSQAPFTVTYSLRRDAQWSDGAPIAAEDFRYLWEQMTSQPGVVDPAGYSLVDDVGSADGGKTVSVVFRSPYPAWRELFTGLLPSHLVKDAPGGFTAALDDGIAVSGARFGIRSVDRDRGEIRLVRNDRFWDTPAEPDEILVRRSTGTTELAASLRTGNTQASLVHGGDATLTQLGLVPGVRTVPVVEPTTLGITASTVSPELADPALRAGVMGLLDPATLSVVGSRGGDLALSDRAQVLAPAELGYTATAPDRPSSTAARAALVATGLSDVGGALTRDGAPLELTIGADEADPVAVAIAQSASDQLTTAGLTATARPEPSATLFGADLSSGDVDLVVHRTAVGGDPATALASRFGCPAATPAPVTTSPGAGTASGAGRTTTTAPATTTGPVVPTTSPGPTVGPQGPTEDQRTATRGANLSGVCLPQLQDRIDAALRGDADPYAVVAEAEPLLWAQDVYLPLFQDRVLFSASSQLGGVDLGGGLVAGPLSSAPAWVRDVP